MKNHFRNVKTNLFSNFLCHYQLFIKVSENRKNEKVCIFNYNLTVHVCHDSILVWLGLSCLSLNTPHDGRKKNWPMNIMQGLLILQPWHFKFYLIKLQGYFHLKCTFFEGEMELTWWSDEIIECFQMLYLVMLYDAV